MDTELAIPRPLLRGYIHLGSAAATLGAWLFLLGRASQASAVVSSVVLGAATLALFTTSASYHLLPWRDRAHRVMKRLDHAMIFVAIAGLFTPFCLRAMSPAWGGTMLALSWTLALAGVAAKVTRPDMPRWLGVGLYLVAGWLPVISAFEVAGHLPVRALLTVLASGLIYSLGGVFYATKRPDIFPRVFGFHEVFHALTAVGTALLWAVAAVYLVS